MNISDIQKILSCWLVPRLKNPCKEIDIDIAILDYIDLMKEPQIPMSHIPDELFEL